MKKTFSEFYEFIAKGTIGLAIGVIMAQRSAPSLIHRCSDALYRFADFRLF